MKIAITGASGFVGSALIPSLTGKGYQIVRLVRSQPKSGGTEIRWDPAAGTIDAPALEGFDAVIHLAGDPIAEGRWTEEKKGRIRESRVKGTRLLAETIAKLSQPPKVFLCASAVGWYGNRGDEILTEESSSGSGFLAEVGREWEEAAAPAAQKGVRIVKMRFGIILHPAGGALKKMLPPFRMGVGGPFGNGKQFMSWITLDDVVGAIAHALANDSLRGPVNTVAPNPVTNWEFSKTLGKVLHRPVLLSVPAFAARILFGEMADEALLASAQVQPAKLLAGGYRFLYPELEPALRHLLKK